MSDKYDSEEVVKKIRNIKRSLANEAPIDVPAGRKRAAGSRDYDCADCAPRRKYDSQEVVKKVRNVDHSRVINTRTVVPVRTRVKETNRLVIHQNETRLTGVVIQHNHTIVEKEIRYVRRIPVQTRVEFVTHNYRVVERPDTITVPVTLHRPNGCYRPGRAYVGYGSCRPALARPRIIRPQSQTSSEATPAAGTNAACRRGNRRFFRFPESSAGTSARSSPRPPRPSAGSSGLRRAPPPRASASASGRARAG